MSHYHDHCPICGVQWFMHGPACNAPAYRYYGQGEIPHKCPVCNGRGLVPASCYYTTASEETCNACNGAGVLWR